MGAGAGSGSSAGAALLSLPAAPPCLQCEETEGGLVEFQAAQKAPKLPDFMFLVLALPMPGKYSATQLSFQFLV